MKSDDSSLRDTPQILAAAESHARELSRFLGNGFQMTPRQRGILSPEMLRWKYFEPRGHWTGPRSFIVEADGKILAHIGVTTTEFVMAHDPAQTVPAVFPVDWLSSQQGGMLGAMLMLKAFGRGQVQYSFGSTESGQKVLLGAGFKPVCRVPSFWKVFRPGRLPVWQMIHGQQKIPKRMALLAVDMGRSIFHPGLAAAKIDLELEPVQEFTGEIAAVLRASRERFVCTSRAPELLNYLLRLPGGRVGGWRCKIAGRLAGFALTSAGERGGFRAGKIVDCFMADADATTWQSAIRALTGRRVGAACDVAHATAPAPRCQRALRA